MLLSLHPNIIVHVENVVILFSSPSTSSQKVRKCGGAAGWPMTSRYNVIHAARHGGPGGCAGARIKTTSLEETQSLSFSR